VVHRVSKKENNRVWAELSNPAFLLGKLKTSPANLVRLKGVPCIADRSDASPSLTKLASAAVS